MNVRIIRDLTALEALQPAWRALVDEMPEATPFQLPEWALTWWKHFGSGVLHVFSFFEEGRLCGLVPCFVHEWNGRRQLTLIGSGISDYNDPPLPERAIPPLSETLSTLQNWDVLNWQDLSVNHTLLALPDIERQDDAPCTELPLAGSFDEFIASRSKDLRRNCRRYSERARQLGSVQFDVATAADPELMNALIRLHASRWERRGESGMIAANRSEAFLRDIAGAFSSAGLVRFFSIRFNGQIVAIVLAFLYRNRIFGYMSAFDPRYEQLGFGRALLFESFRYAFAQRYTAWNFLRGAEAYKLSWGAVLIPKSRLYKAR